MLSDAATLAVFSNGSSKSASHVPGPHAARLCQHVVFFTWIGMAKQIVFHPIYILVTGRSFLKVTDAILDCGQSRIHITCSTESIMFNVDL